MYNSNSNASLLNCIFIDNSANKEGGALYCRLECDVLINNCTFVKNSANNGTVLACDSAHMPSSHLQLANCILWDEGNEVWIGDNSTVTIDYSDVQGGWLGKGNISADPNFVAPTSGDYRLLPSSLCINAGDPNYVRGPNETDLDGKPRVIGGRIDMGAYEYSPPISAEARIVPRTVNLVSKGKWIAAFLRLPEEYNVADIDPDTVFLEEQIKAEQLSVNEQQQVAIAKFSRGDVQAILDIGEIELTLTGRLNDGTPFEGTDVIRVIDKSGGKLPK